MYVHFHCIGLVYFYVLRFSSHWAKPNILRHSLLPAATKLWPRLCFYSCLWFCSRGGGSASVHAGIPPPLEAGTTSPWEAYTPSQGRRQTPPPHPRHTVNKRPVRILLECILISNFSAGRNSKLHNSRFFPNFESPSFRSAWTKRKRDSTQFYCIWYGIVQKSWMAEMWGSVCFVRPLDCFDQLGS